MKVYWGKTLRRVESFRLLGWFFMMEVEFFYTNLRHLFFISVASHSLI